MEKILYPKEIQILFGEITKDISRVLDPDYILVIGSFGKGSWLYENEKLISDFEFVFLSKKKWSIKNKKKLLKKLNKKYPYDFSLKGYLIKNVKKNILSNYTSKPSSYTSLIFYDNFSYPQFLYHKVEDKKDDVLEVNFNIIPAWEAWRLLVNRIGDIISLLNDETNSRYKYYWLKIFEAIADAYLINNQMYKKSIDFRFDIFKKNIFINDHELNDEMIESYEQIRNALYARRENQLNKFEIVTENKMNIVKLWLEYFEKKVIKDENLNISRKISFEESYLCNRVLQEKYLESEKWYAIFISNVIRLVKTPLLFNKTFKYFSFNNSWRHISLLSISSLFKEQLVDSNSLNQTRRVLKKIFFEKYIYNLSFKELNKIVVKYWKLLR